jgi:hypothetical protein
MHPVSIIESRGKRRQVAADSQRPQANATTSPLPGLLPSWFSVWNSSTIETGFSSNTYHQLEQQRSRLGVEDCPKLDSLEVISVRQIEGSANF